ncbi:UNVERIFIED_CONTAM: hypothetical protein K2H54_060190 [Gekko kuhli]
MAYTLRESAQLFQSDEMRPANDPKERAPTRVRMLNDVLQSLEKNFLVQQVPPGFYSESARKKLIFTLSETILSAGGKKKSHQGKIMIRIQACEISAATGKPIRVIALKLSEIEWLFEAQPCWIETKICLRDSDRG